MALRDLPESTVSLVHVWHSAPGPMGRLSHCCCSDCAKLCTVRRTNAPPSLCNVCVVSCALVGKSVRELENT
jgi:hypothetical protein